MQKLWRWDYNFNVNKDPLLARFNKNIRYHWLWNCYFLSFKSTTHDIIELNPALLVIVASHIRPRAMINTSFHWKRTIVTMTTIHPKSSHLKHHIVLEITTLAFIVVIVTTVCFQCHLGEWLWSWWHRSQPDVWGNNDHQHRIKPLHNICPLGQGRTITCHIARCPQINLITKRHKL